MSFSSRVMTPADWAKIKHFDASEFNYPMLMGYEFMVWLDHLREEAGVPIHITSDHRTAAHNAEVGGAPDSAHVDVPCDSVDIGMRPRPDDANWNYSRWRITFAAEKLGCRRIGHYKDGSMHIDRTETKRPSPRMWHVVSGH